MYAVIDVGSNTIRLSIFKLEKNVIKPYLHKKIMAGLANYVDETGNLSEKGISIAVSALNKFNKIISDIEINKPYAFATASLRNIGNTEEVLKKIAAGTGLDLQVISGEQEAIYGYIGATHDLYTEKGILVDIGGGSTELVFYKDGKIQKAFSMPVGSLNMYSKHVKTLIPNKSEIKTISQSVEKQLINNVAEIDVRYSMICGVGGSIRAACKLNNEIYELPASNNELGADHIAEIIKTIRGNDKDSLNHILKTAPDRIHTVIPGMTILQTITDYFQCKTIKVSKYGIREGYLLQNLISEGLIHE